MPVTYIINYETIVFVLRVYVFKLTATVHVTSLLLLANGRRGVVDSTCNVGT